MLVKKQVHLVLLFFNSYNFVIIGSSRDCLENRSYIERQWESCTCTVNGNDKCMAHTSIYSSLN